MRIMNVRTCVSNLHGIRYLLLYYVRQVGFFLLIYSMLAKHASGTLQQEFRSI